MNIQGKVWGTTSLLFCKNNVEIHRITGKKGGYCSKHKHEHKYNLFFVEKGCLRIKIWKKYGLVDETELIANQICIVDPGDFHMFAVLEDDTIALEVYWVDMDSGDIVREEQGGFIES